MAFNDKDKFEPKFGLDTSEFEKKLKRLEKNTEASMRRVTAVTNTASIAFAGLATAIAFTTAEFAKYERGLIAVQKTSNLSDRETEQLGRELITLSKKAPIAVDALLEIAEAAGQLGIEGRKNIGKFTETVAKLGATTNLEGEEAAKILARILNVTGENVESVDKLGSAFVQLGNSVAASEAEIAVVASEVAKSTAIFKIGSSNVVGLSASMAELGIQAEAGGSIVGRAFIEIKNGIDKGGDSLEKLSIATGIAAADLKQAFEKDATGVFVKFLESVKKVNDEGGNTTDFLTQFGLDGVRVNKVLAPMALRVDSLTTNLAAANKEFEDGTALEDEFAKKAAGLSSQLLISKNKLDDATRTMGEKFAPTVVKTTEKVADFIDKFNELDDETIELVANSAIIATSIAGITLALGLATKAFLALKLAAIATLGAVGVTAAATVATVTAAAIALKIIVDEGQKANDQLASDIDSHFKRQGLIDAEIIKRKEETFKKIEQLTGASNEEIKKLQDELAEDIIKLQQSVFDDQVKISEDGKSLATKNKGEIVNIEIDHFKKLKQLRDDASNKLIQKQNETKTKELQIISKAEKEKQALQAKTFEEQRDAMRAYLMRRFDNSQEDKALLKKTENDKRLLLTATFKKQRDEQRAYLMRLFDNRVEDVKNFKDSEEQKQRDLAESIAILSKMQRDLVMSLTPPGTDKGDDKDKEDPFQFSFKFDAFISAMANSIGDALDDLFNDQDSSFGDIFNKLIDSLSKDFDSFTDALNEGDWMGAIVSFFAGIALNDKEFAEAFNELAATFQEMFGPIIHELIPILRAMGRVLQAIAPAIRSMAPAIGVIAGVIVSIADALVVIANALGAFNEGVKEINQGLEDTVDALRESMEFTSELSEWMSALNDSISDLMGGLAELLEVFKFFGEAFQEFGSLFDGFTDAFSGFSEVGKALTDALGELTGFIKVLADAFDSFTGVFGGGGGGGFDFPGFADGLVPQISGTTADRFPAMLQPGEMVVPKAETPGVLKTIRGEGGSPQHGVFEIRLKDNLVDFITVQQIANRNLGTGQ